MDYIQTNYGTVLPKQLQDNEIALDAQWDPTTPIAVLFTRIEDFKLLSKAGEDPFTDKYIFRSSYLAIEDTGLFNLPCDTWQENPTSAKNWSNFKLFFTKEASNIKHHTTGSVGISDEAANAILLPRYAFLSQQQEIANICAAQEQLVNSAAEYKDLRAKVHELMAKINSTKVQHQEESGNPTPSKLKGTTNNSSCTEGYDRYGYPIIYSHTHGIIRNLAHSSMNCKFSSDTHKKEATLFNQMGRSAVTNKHKHKKRQVVSGGDTHFSNNVNYSITQYLPCANQNTPSDTPPVDAQTTKKILQMGSKS